MSRPDGALVADAWLRLVTGLPAACVGPTLPAARRDPAPAWVTQAFVQHTVVGGAPMIHVPLRLTVVQLDVWAVTLDDRAPPWGRASDVAETIWARTFDDNTQQLALTVPDGYDTPHLRTVYALAEPRKVREDAAGFAHFQFDAQFVWAPSTLALI